MRAPCLRHVRASTAFAADLLGDEVDEFAGFDLFGEIVAHPGNQGDFVGFNGGQYDDTGFKFVFEFVERFAQ